MSIEPADNVFPVLKHRFSTDPRVRTIKATIDEVDLPDSADSLVAVNVLEHIEDDEGFLRAASRIVVKDGHVLLFVPANEFLFGSLDKAFDHYRRYSKESLSSVLSRSGWKVLTISNVNIAGIIPWFIAGKVLGKRTIGPRQMRFFDRVVIPVMRRIESIQEPFIGQSLLAVARNARK